MNILKVFMYVGMYKIDYFKKLGWDKHVELLKWI